MAQDGGSGFARDFGYLMPFLQKVEQAARQRGDAELQQLVDGERARWTRIQQLLGGGAKPAAAGASASAGAPAAKAAKAPGGNGSVPTTLTVGSLRGSVRGSR